MLKWVGQCHKCDARTYLLSLAVIKAFSNILNSSSLNTVQNYSIDTTSNTHKCPGKCIDCHGHGHCFGICSGQTNVAYGVPQGYMLYRLVFMVYMHDRDALHLLVFYHDVH